MNKKILLLLFFLILIIGCAKEERFMDYLHNAIIPDRYAVHGESGYSSSGGTRSWEYDAVIQREEVLFYDGHYEFSGGKPHDRITKCTTDNYKQEKDCISPSKITSIITGLQEDNLTQPKTKKVGDLICFYNFGSERRKRVLICFNSEKIPLIYSSKGIYGGGLDWSIDKHELTKELENLRDSY